MGKYWIIIGLAVLVIIGLIIERKFIGSSLKKEQGVEDENHQLPDHEDGSQAYADLTHTGVRVKLKLIQAVYLAYAILYIHWSATSPWDAVATYMTMTAYKILSAVALLYTIVIMVYNAKFETRQTARSACYVGTVGMVFGILLMCIKNM